MAYTKLKKTWPLHVKRTVHEHMHHSDGKKTARILFCWWYKLKDMQVRGRFALRNLLEVAVTEWVIVKDD